MCAYGEHQQRGDLNVVVDGVGRDTRSVRVIGELRGKEMEYRVGGGGLVQRVNKSEGHFALYPKYSSSAKKREDQNNYY